MRIYLDMCCYNRQFDNKISEAIVNDYNIMIQIQKEIVSGHLELATSFMLHYENYRKKDADKRDKIDLFIKSYRTIYIGVDFVDDLKPLSEEIVATGIKAKDAYHIASAILAHCDFFITVDKKILKYSSERIKIISLDEFARVLEV